jgi:hypothetical protein
MPRTGKSIMNVSRRALLIAAWSAFCEGDYPARTLRIDITIDRDIIPTFKALEALLCPFLRELKYGLPLPRAIKQDDIGDRSNLAILVHRTSVILPFQCTGPADDGLSQLLI